MCGLYYQPRRHRGQQNCRKYVAKRLFLGHLLFVYDPTGETEIVPYRNEAGNEETERNGSVIRFDNDNENNISVPGPNENTSKFAVFVV